MTTFIDSCMTPVFFYVININHKIPQVHGCLDETVARMGRTHRELIKETFKLRKLID